PTELRPLTGSRQDGAQLLSNQACRRGQVHRAPRRRRELHKLRCSQALGAEDPHLDETPRTVADASVVPGEPKGILSLCAACRRVREDGAAWHQVERYRRDRTGAELSPGPCPECATQLYPEL
ncbi:MAG: hypothetical protein V3T05_01560, partial [Myxococcota bacterium]